MPLPNPLCKVCSGRLDALLWSVGRHPGCRTSGPLDEASLARLVTYLADVVGAVTVRANHTEGDPQR